MFDHKTLPPIVDALSYAEDIRDLLSRGATEPDDEDEYVLTLATEVLRLRGELLNAQKSHEQTCGEGHVLRTKLARVEALPRYVVHVLGSGLYAPAVLVNDIETALRDDQPDGETC